MSVRRSSGWIAEHLGPSIGIGLCVGSALAAFVGAGALIVLLPLAALMAAVWLVQRHERPDYLELVIWLWLLTPWVRRVVDMHSGYSDESVVLLVAPLASLPGIATGLLRPMRVRPEVRRVFVVALFAVAYATAAGVIRFGTGPALVGGTVWLAPLGVGLWVAATPCPTHALRRAVGRLSVAGALVLGVYGMYQFFRLPEWDAHWMENVDLVSIGTPVALGVRVFGTLNAPVPYAMVLGALLIVASTVPSRWRVLIATAGMAGLALSVVRTAWVGFAAALAAMLVSGRERTARAALMLVVVPAVLLVVLGGPVRDTVISRFDATVEKGTEDRSFADRTESYGVNLPRAATDLVGRGFGQVGAGASAVDDDAGVETNTAPDSAILEALFSMGSVVGTAFLVAVTVGVLGTLRRSRQGGELDRAMAAALLGLLVQVPLGNPFNSAPAAVFWMFLAVAARTEARAGRDIRTLDQRRLRTSP